MIKGGQYEMGHSASYYWKGKDVTTAILHHRAFWHDRRRSRVPGCYYGDGMELHAEMSMINSMSMPFPAATPASRWVAGSARKSSPSTT